MSFASFGLHNYINSALAAAGFVEPASGVPPSTFQSVTRLTCSAWRRPMRVCWAA